MLQFMKDAFVMLEGDIVQWAHAQAASKGTSVTSLISAMLRDLMAQAAPQTFGDMASGLPMEAASLAGIWPQPAESARFSHWPRRIVDED